VTVIGSTPQPSRFSQAWYRFLRQLGIDADDAVSFLASHPASFPHTGRIAGPFALVTGVNTKAHGLGRDPVGCVVVADDARPVRLSVYRNGALTLTSAAVIPVAHDVETYNDGADFSAGALTLPHTGRYRVESALWFAAGASGDRCYLAARLDSAVVAAGSRIAAVSAANTGCSIACYVSGTAEQVLDVSAQPNSTGASMACVTGATLTWLTIESDDALCVSSHDATNLTIHSARARNASFWVW
jgi:hypothetical protein